MFDVERDPTAKLHLLFVIDPIETLNPGHDSSVALMEAAQSRGHDVSFTTMRELEVEGGSAVAASQQIVVEPAYLDGSRWIAEPTWFRVISSARVRVDAFDAVFVRTDPPVDESYIRGTYVLDFVDTSRTLMVNRPSGLRDANEKLFALRLPELGPESFVSADVQRILSRVEEWGRAVLKPTDAMAGRGIMVLSPGDANLHSIIESATSRGRDHVVVQRWIDDVVHGDRRVIVLDGKPLGSVRRVALGEDFRCNMAAGAIPMADEVTDADIELCTRLAPKLRELGLVFVGIDVIGGLLTEVNVTSPTGLREIDALSGSHLADDIVRWVERTRATALVAS